MRIPSFLNFSKKYGLLLSDAEVTLLSWHKGNLHTLGLFSNDEAGLIRFADFLDKHEKSFHNKSFHILVNIIGEDYRFEKVVHLLGKYKMDFHARRMQQLFRGSQLTMSEVQGREEHGRREDWVLFAGVLTENKVMPWMAVISRAGGRCVAGVHMVSQLTESLLGAMGGDQGNNLVMTIHERGVMRQTYYFNGHLRFSRVSKINDENAERMGASIRRELERTLQYFHSLKISVAKGLIIRMASPSSMVGQLREFVSGGEKIRFEVYDAARIAQKIGLKTPIGDLGRDSSLALQIMFTKLILPYKQLAKARFVTYHWLQMMAKVSMALLAAYGLYAYSVPLTYFKNGYGYARDVAELKEKEVNLKRSYDAEVSSVGAKPPSSPKNMRAVSNLYQVMDSISVSPTRLLYFWAEGLGKNRNVRVDNIRWYLSNDDRGSDVDAASALISGRDVYQILVVRGELTPLGEETYMEVANRFDKLYDSFGERNDMRIDKIEFPTKELATDNLAGSLSSAKRVDAPRSRSFVLRIVWKAYGKENFDQFAAEV